MNTRRLESDQFGGLALIRRFAAEGEPKARIAARLGISRTTVIKAVASESPPQYVRKPVPTSFTPFEARVRSKDVDWRAQTVSVKGTLVDDPSRGLLRQERLKARDQARLIRLPSFALSALNEARKRRPDYDEESPNSPAIQRRVLGAWCHARNIRRSLRELRQEPLFVDALATTGLAAGDVCPHILRRTAATLVAMSSGDLRDAQHLLGRSDLRTTMRHYPGAPFRTLAAATVLDDLLGGRTHTRPT